MAKLIYVSPTSLDGYIGRDDYGWSTPTEEALAFMTDVMRPIGTFLYGRKTYETMAVWETPEVLPELTPATKDFAQIWQAADKIVYSKTLHAASTPRTRLEQEFDPQLIRNLKNNLNHNFSIGGPNIAAQAIHAGLVDEYHLFVVPAMIGHGIPVFPPNINIKLELVDERRFGTGWIYLRYQTQVY